MQFFTRTVPHVALDAKLLRLHPIDSGEGCDCLLLQDGDYAMRKCLTDMEGALAPEGKWSKPIDQWTDEEVTVEGDKQRQVACMSLAHVSQCQLAQFAQYA
eukprot:5524588-Amphidinium_carterae.1